MVTRFPVHRKERGTPSDNGLRRFQCRESRQLHHFRRQPEFAFLRSAGIRPSLTALTTFAEVCILKQAASSCNVSHLPVTESSHRHQSHLLVTETEPSRSPGSNKRRKNQGSCG